MRIPLRHAGAGSRMHINTLALNDRLVRRVRAFACTRSPEAALYEAEAGIARRGRLSHAHGRDDVLSGRGAAIFKDLSSARRFLAHFSPSPVLHALMNCDRGSE